MSINPLVGVLSGALVVLAVGGGVLYSNMNTRLTNVGDELRDTEKERDQLAAKLQEREKELSSLGERAELSDEQLAKEREEIRRLHGGIGVIGECLSGVLQSMSASNSGDEARSALLLLSVVESCKTSGKIIEEVQALQASSANSASGGGTRAIYR
jgi:uncharacterized protein YlxW (UPF0749 family)